MSTNDYVYARHTISGRVERVHKNMLTHPAFGKYMVERPNGKQFTSAPKPDAPEVNIPIIDAPEVAKPATKTPKEKKEQD